MFASIDLITTFQVWCNNADKPSIKSLTKEGDSSGFHFYTKSAAKNNSDGHGNYKFKYGLLKVFSSKWLP